MSTALANQNGATDIMERPITYRPFMGTTDIVLTAKMVLTLLAKPTRTGKLPTPAQAIRFAKLCEARGLNPWEGDAYLVGYDAKDGPEFNLITAHQAFLKRAEVHPEFDGMESGVVVADDSGHLTDQAGDFVANEQTLAGGWARVHFKTRKIPTYRRINLSTFTTGRSRWEKDPAGMIVKCAEADALRSSFPTKLGGMYLREEFDTVIDAKPERPSIPMPRSLEYSAPSTPPASLPPHAPTSEAEAGGGGSEEDIGGEDDRDQPEPPQASQENDRQDDSQTSEIVLPSPCSIEQITGLLMRLKPRHLDEPMALTLVDAYLKTKLAKPWAKLSRSAQESLLKLWINEGFPPFIAP